eukprot:SAG31_NODE_19329_length_605_cov_1.978261_1_plen_63_part_10
MLVIHRVGRARAQVLNLLNLVLGSYAIPPPPPYLDQGSGLPEYCFFFLKKNPHFGLLWVTFDY